MLKRQNFLLTLLAGGWSAFLLVFFPGSFAAAGPLIDFREPLSSHVELSPQSLFTFNPANGTGTSSLFVMVDASSNGSLWLISRSGTPFQLKLDAGASPSEAISWNRLFGDAYVAVLSPNTGQLVLAVVDDSGSGQRIRVSSTIVIPNLTKDSPGTMFTGTDGNLYISTGNGQIVQVNQSLQVNGGPKPSASGSSLKAAAAPWIIPTPSGAVTPPSALNFAAGADGNIWFTESPALDVNGLPASIGKEKIGRITPTGVITEFDIPTGFAGTGSKDKTTGSYITAGPDGNVWFTEASAGKLAQITPAGVITEFKLPTQYTILGLVSGPDGNLWVKDYAGKIYRVTPSGTVTSFTIPTKSAGRDVELVPAPDGALWFVEDTQIGKITTSGMITEYTLPTPTVGGTPVYPFQLKFTSDGFGAFLQFTTNKLATFTVPVSAVSPTTTTMVEYLYRPLNYFFITSRDSDKTLLDTAAGWERTGMSFPVYTAATADAQAISRYYFDKVALRGSRGSHFYTLVSSEKAALAGLNPGNTQAPGLPYNEGIDSWAFLPAVEGVGGSCASGRNPVYRLFRGSAKFPDDPNHRFTTSLTTYNDYVRLGWDGEGVKFCVPAQ